MKRILFFILVISCLLGCNRAIYINLQGDKAAQKISIERVESTPGFNDTQWQHFFIYGLVPGERVIDAANICNGAEHVVAIKTKQTFLEGLVASVAGYYVNIYSPYDGYVICDKGLGFETKKDK